ncbi:MAG: OmpA family protein [Lutibacter sp.]|uniref:OmpA family protein n=1 Tax=Lutibacter sp. TaxID=1925666 RepID=UPI001850C037|nr:OmpA family protein [Lutibacter sp.]MBT8316162.1 OmpA family protein [Lutibacter sp.]NNJ57022.1 OmpA family protein [Lutibacter sp.]
MLNYFKAFSFFLLWALIALISHSYLSASFYENCTSNSEISSKESIAEEKQFVITDEFNNIIYNFPEGFIINKNNNKYTSPKEILNLVDSIQRVLIYDYSKELHITGKYLKSELANTSGENMGLQRANSLKQELVTLGIDASKIKVSEEIANFEYINGQFSNGIKINFNTLKQYKIDSIEFEITNKKLYLEFVNDSIIVNNDLIKYANNLKFYSKKYPAKKIVITGHTDNLGYFDKNLVTGLKNANTLKDYFIENGIDNIKIETFSKGESEPIADKTTEKGRALNRRIEVTLIN